MKARNFGQAKKQKEAARKARQQQKLDRRHGRTEPAAEPEPAAPADPAASVEPAADPKVGS